MPRLKNSVVGRSVFSKKDGLEGFVIREDGLTLVVALTGIDGVVFNRRITYRQFINYYRLTDKKDLPIDAFMKKDLYTGKTCENMPVGEQEKVSVVWNRFRDILMQSANQDLDLRYTSSKILTVYYNSNRIFHIRISKKRIIVYTVKDALSPFVRKYAWSIDPNLHTYKSAMFIFTNTTQVPIIRALIFDELYFHQVVDYGQFKTKIN